MIENEESWGADLYFDESRKTISIGRNGAYTSIGVNVYAQDSGEILITGITQRRQSASGLLRIPKEDIPEFIKLLNRLI